MAKNSIFEFKGTSYDIDAVCSGVTSHDWGSFDGYTQGDSIYYKGDSVDDIMDGNNIRHINSVNYILYLEHKINILEKLIMSVASEEMVGDYKKQIDLFSKILTEKIKTNE